MVKESLSFNIFLIVIFFIIVLVFLLYWNKETNKSYYDNDNGKDVIREYFKTGNDFYLHNYYKIPIYVTAKPKNSGEMAIIKHLPSKDRKGIKNDMVKKYIRDGTQILVYEYDDIEEDNKGKLINEVTLNLPENKTIKALHIGQSQKVNDAMFEGSYGVSSGLGSSLPLIRLVNNSPRKLTLISGSQHIIMSPYSTWNYFGEQETGIHLGTSIKDKDGILEDIDIDKPTSDIHIDMINDIKLPSYSQAHNGNVVENKSDSLEFYPLQTGEIGHHRGGEADRSLIL